MDLYSISVMSVGATLALIMLFLVWKPNSLHNTTQLHVMPCYWSHSFCNAYQIYSMIFVTVRWLVSYISYSIDSQFCVTHCVGVPLLIHHNSDGVD